MRRLVVVSLIVVLFCLSAISSPVQATEEPAKVLASPEVANKAIDVVTTFLKRAGSSNLKVRSRGWAMLSPNLQNGPQYMGDPNAFSFLKSEIYGFGQVVVDDQGFIVVPVTLSGFINKHGLYDVNFLLTNDGQYLIERYSILSTVTVPARMTTTEVLFILTDNEITAEKSEISMKDVDVLLLHIRNSGQQHHQIQIFRLDDGKTVDELVALIQESQITTGVAESYGYALIKGGEETTKTIGIVDVEPGTYVVTGFGGMPNPDTLVGVYATFTVKK